MKLSRLQLRNFKGIKQLDINLGGGSAKIFGDNATGKTTIADAITYVLFDKDTAGNQPASFGIKTRDENGDVIHGLEHEVTATFDSVELRKVYTEVWRSVKGSIEKELRAHSTDHFINEQPVKKKDYEARVAQEMSEEMFKMLTVPSYFPEELHWSDRRKVLRQMAGEIDVDTIIEATGLTDYIEIIGDKNEEAQEDILKSKRKKLLSDIEDIPARIDEQRRSKSDVGNVDGLTTSKEELQSKLSNIQDEIQTLSRGGGVHELNEKMQEYKTEQSVMRTKHQEAVSGELQELRDKSDELRDKKGDIKSEIREIETSIDNNARLCSDKECKLGELKENVEQVESNSFTEPESEDVCPYCEQPIEGHSEEDIEAERKKFNAEKASSIKDMRTGIEKVEKEIEELKEAIEKNQEEVIAKTEERESLDEHLSELSSKIEKIKGDSTPVEETDEWKALQNKMDALNKKISTIKDNKQEAIDELERNQKEIVEKIEGINEKLSDYNHNKKIDERIKELQNEQKSAQVELEEVEHGLYVIEQFRHERAKIITSRVNEMFNGVTWKLFETQMNGEIKSVCEPIYKGVPYSEGLNNADRIKAGIEIIEVLSAHFDKQAPLIVDNAESITQLPDTDLQMIALIVSEVDKELRI